MTSRANPVSAAWSRLPAALQVGLRATWYLTLIAVVWWLWSTPEADFRYWGL